MRSLLIRDVLPDIYKDKPNFDFPCHGDNTLDILSALKVLIRFFDKRLLRRAPFNAFKSSKVHVNGLFGIPIPSESVYDQELYRLLKNGIGPLGVDVIDQFHQKTTE